MLHSLKQKCHLFPVVFVYSQDVVTLNAYLLFASSGLEPVQVFFIYFFRHSAQMREFTQHDF